jgi:hypothetical protein
MNETQAGGPFPEILDYDILVNCIYLSQAIPAFLTSDMLVGERNLSVVVDVSCDYTNPNNPIPIYSQGKYTKQLPVFTRKEPISPTQLSASLPVLILSM